MNLSGLWRASHPGPALVVTLVSLGLGLAAGLGVGLLSLVVAAVLTGQLSIGWSNDWLDALRGWDRGRSDKPVQRAQVAGRTVGVAATAALGLCVVLSLSLGSVAAIVHLVAVASGWAYNLGLKATVASVVPYVVAFGLLPSVVTAAAGGGLAPWWAAVTGSCFGAGVHFANVLPDLRADARAGVRGLPQRLGGRGSVVATVALLGVGAAVVLAAPAGGGAVAIMGGVLCAFLLGAVLITGLRHQYELSLRLSMATGLIVVGLLVLRGDALV